MKTVNYVIFSLLTLVLAYFVFRVSVRRDYERKGKLSALSTLLEILIFAVHANLSYTFLPVKWPGLPALPENSIHKTFGLSFVFIGLVITLWAMSELGFLKALGQQMDELYKSGFYKYSRNPQIVAYSLLLVGFASLWPSFYSLGWVALYGAIAYLMVYTEEENLIRVYGNEYKEYCKKVPRFIPLPWRWNTSLKVGKLKS